MPNDLPFERISRSWDNIGFQGKDPATDFRGQGLLGLTNLMFFAKYYRDDSKEMLSRPHGGFPFAIAAINISAYLTSLIEDHMGEIGNRLFMHAEDAQSAIAVFNELFGVVFLHFDAFYSS